MLISKRKVWSENKVGGVSRHKLALLLSILFVFLGEDSYEEVFQKLRIFKTVIQIILN